MGKIRACYIIASVGSREDKLERLMMSIDKYQPLDVIICLQGYSEKPKFIQKLSNIETVMLIDKPDLIGANNARLLGLREVIDKYDYFINLDDDMVLTDKTNHYPIFDKLSENKQYGLVSGNWRKSMKQIEHTELVDKFVSQRILYTGGGLVYRKDVGQRILSYGDGNYLFDDVEWSLRAYISGYSNYSYKGSLLYAEVSTEDGRREWVRASKKKLNDPELISCKQTKTIVYGNGNDYHIPSSSDLTEQAKALHDKNKKELE